MDSLITQVNKMQRHRVLTMPTTISIHNKSLLPREILVWRKEGVEDRQRELEEGGTAFLPKSTTKSSQKNQKMGREGGHLMRWAQVKVAEEVKGQIGGHTMEVTKEIAFSMENSTKIQVTREGHHHRCPP